MKSMKQIPNRKTTALWRVAGSVLLSLATGFVLAPLDCRAQGRFTIAFEGPPELPPGGGDIRAAYSESGVEFRLVGPTMPWDGVTRYASGYWAEPDNGSTFLIGAQATTNSLGFHFLDGSVFDLLSVDLAEFTLHTDLTPVQFVGYRHDGSVAVADFITDGINDGIGPLMDFQTFHFGSAFTGLDRVEIPSHGWSLDNLVIYVPEPSALALWVVGSGLLWAGRRRAGRHCGRVRSL